MGTTAMIPFEVVARMRQLAERLYETGKTNEAYTLASAITDVVQMTEQPAFYMDTSCRGYPFSGAYTELLRIGCKHCGTDHKHKLDWYIGADHLTLREHTGEISFQNHNLLAIYTLPSGKDISQPDVCPCCGRFRAHAAWCIRPSGMLVWPSAEPG